MKTLTTLTTLAAWKEIKRRYRAGLWEFGLCSCVVQLWRVDEITMDTRLRMENDIEWVRPRNTNPHYFYWPLTQVGTKLRLKAIDRIIKKIVTEKRKG